ncbi:MAG TPA: hypothetical protein VE568_17565 [Rubrobacter sp.]|nr:hypothetical protein [Rubrobacter sp.]
MPRHRKLLALVERSVRSFSRHAMAVYAMALAYRGLISSGLVRLRRESG